MMKKCLSLSLGLVFVVAQSLSAATSISLEANNQLVITDAQGTQVTTLNSGTISEKVTADSQTFKISFGQDLKDRYTLILYPDPQTPQSLDLEILGQPVQMTQDSVLTITTSPDGSSSQFQAGVLGQVTMAGAPISPGSSLSIQNGEMLSTTPIELLDDTAMAAALEDAQSEAIPEAPKTTSASADQLVKNFNQGLVVKEVTGTVMMAPQGQEVMDLLRNSTSIPKLKAGDVIPLGASIRTDFGGQMIVAQSPGVTFQVLENTNLKLDENEYKVENGVEKRKFKASMSKGGIISNLQGLDPNNTDYQIQTPLCVAAARGTAFSVFTSSNISVIITAEGNVEVTTLGGTYSTLKGTKTVVTFEGITGDIKAAAFEADAAELAAIDRLIGLANTLNFINNNPGFNPAVQQSTQDLLDQAVDDFIETFEPTLEPGAITPTTSGG
jgi:hypothetical protein